MPTVESPVELMPRITYFLSPGPKSWTDRPGIWPAMSMNAEEPARCSQSPLIAWMEAGTSRTLWALSLLAVTTISSIGADSPAVSAATAGAPASRAVMPALTASMQPETLCLFVDWSPVARRSIDVSPVLCDDNMSYHMKYQVYGPGVASGSHERPRAGYPPRLSSHIPAHAPNRRESRGEFLRREAFQQALLTAAHHDIERVEQRATFVGQEYLDISGVVAAQHSPDIVFLFHVHEGAAERRLLHHRAIDDLVDGDAVAHGEHGQDTPPCDVDAFTPQLLDQIVVELVGQLGDQMRKEIIEHRLVRRFQRFVRGASRACKGSRPFDSSHVQNGLWPLRMAPSFGASMLPPETMQIISPLPAWPVMAAATDAAPAASAMM